MINDFLQIVKTGITITTGAASANAAIPTDSANTNPKYIRLSATAGCYVKVGPSGVTAAAGDILIMPGDALVIGTCGQTFVAAIQQTAAGVLQVSPVENS